MRKSTGIIIGFFIILIVILLIIGLSTDSLLFSILNTHKQTIVDATIVVPPSQYVIYPIDPHSSYNSCKIQGTFSARGGSDDIRVYVVDQQGFNAFRNDNKFQAYFSTPQQVRGDIATTVPCDKKIYLIYDNSFSLITGKTVTTKVDFKFEQIFQDPNKVYLDDDILQPLIPTKPIEDPND
ncbi:MAG: hypothetical protein ACREAJ_03625 [Nitrosopumilaceae archaeon]